MEPRESFETVAGCRIRLQRSGAGAPLLFLHGAEGPAGWLPFMATLSRAFAVTAPEHPGFGASDTPDWLDRVGDLAYFYLDVIDRLELDGIHLVGASLGGWIAAEIAVRNCSRLATLTLASAVGIHEKGLRKADIFLWSPEQTARNFVHDPVLAETMLAGPQTESQQMVVLKNRLTTARLGWQPRLHNPDLRKWLHRISVPTLVLWGEEDRVVPPAYGPVWRDLVPGARLETIPGCGHLPHLEKPELCGAIIARFIAEATP